MGDNRVKEAVKERYGQAALRVTSGKQLLWSGTGGRGLRSDHVESL
jgi:hypothetical protein